MAMEGATAGQRFEELVRLIARLRAPGGCPWDREQTHESLKPMTLEEAYEVLEAIDQGDDKELANELGDLLLQVVFHAQIATDEGRFTIHEIVDGLKEKMVRRHPHVFGEERAATSGDVLRNWETLKTAEQAGKGASGDSMLDSVSTRLPAVMEAFQLTTKVARVGFDWPNVPAVLDKLDEEVRELKRALAGGQSPRAVGDEVGDLLFVLVNIARLLGQDPESALKATNRKFRRRFRHVEERLRESGRTPADASLDEMESLWAEAKLRERKGGRGGQGIA